MKRTVTTFTFLFAALLLTAVARGQTTGKISGRVTEAGTGQPLPGVNVRIDGTTQGTATDVDGEYVIIGVRPGSYTVVASYVGYTTVRQEGVRLSVDLTTKVDFEMGEEVIVGEELTLIGPSVYVADVTLPLEAVTRG